MNDDRSDNRFYDSLGRFPAIVEDEPPLHLLCTDYARYYKPYAGCSETTLDRPESRL